jgi:hypothetical protein
MVNVNQQLLVEHLSPVDAQVKVLTENIEGSKDKKYFMEGIFIQGEVKNYNGRVYPGHEIKRAVEQINEKLKKGNSILGEVDHPDNLQINLDRVSHQLVGMKMDGNNGVGKLQIIPTEMGRLICTFLEHNVKLGVSSRGTGEVGYDGCVKNFEIVTVDIVAQPSAPDAYPKPILEALESYKRRGVIVDLIESARNDSIAQKFLANECIKFIQSLKL